MFQYATEQGWKELEWMILWGCQHGLPKLGPQISKEEFRDLYYEVYKLRRLPRSPPWELEWMEKLAVKIISSLKTTWAEGVKPPRRGKWDTSAERGLAEVREAHQKALVTAAILEEELRVTELVHHPGLVRGPYPLQELGSLQKKILGMEQEALLGMAGGQPCPFL